MLSLLTVVKTLIDFQAFSLVPDGNLLTKEAGHSRKSFTQNFMDFYKISLRITIRSGSVKNNNALTPRPGISYS